MITSYVNKNKGTKIRLNLLAMLTLGLSMSAASVTANETKLEVNFSQQAQTSLPTQVVFVEDVDALSGAAAQLDKNSSGQLSKLLKLNEFSAKKGSALKLQLIAGADTVLVVGTHDEDGLDAPELQDIGGIIATHLSSTTTNVNASINVDDLSTEVKTPSAHIAYGYDLRHYSFDKYQAKKDNGESRLTFVSSQAKDAEQKYAKDLAYLADGTHMARNFATEPGNKVYPQVFADTVVEKFKSLDKVSVRVLDVPAMEKLNMGALLGVGKGSINDPRLIIVEYMGGKKGDAPIALAGKGITFDTGGISIKGNDGMWAMKSDLSGAAAVAGVMYALAQRGEKVNVVGLMAMAENMPSQDAIRPGDVLTTMQGTTIEIMSTDAEGRLVLSDAVYYAQQEYKPKLLLNIATLTGSAARALSDEYAALITRNFDFSAEVMSVGERSGEHVWPLPLHANHFEQIKSPIADIKNSGAGNPGASIGAAVIATFVDEDLPWIHLDIAGVDWLSNDIHVAPKGSQGWGVRFMDQLVRDHASK